MTNQEFINKCKWRVSDYLNKLVGKETACKPENVFVVWQAKALQNHKAMLAAPGRYNDKDYYFEFTYNGNLNETVMLDEVYQDGQSYVSKKLPRIGARFDMLRKPTLYR